MIKTDSLSNKILSAVLAGLLVISSAAVSFGAPAYAADSKSKEEIGRAHV